MREEKISTVILAAGKGERMKSSIPKVMHEIIDKPMIGYVVDVAKSIGFQKIVVVVGYGKEQVVEYLKDKGVIFCVQDRQEGTAHAVLCAKEIVSGTDVLILYGDVPLIEKITIKRFLDFYLREKEITFMVTEVDDPSGYGRVIMNGQSIERIVEEKDAKEEELLIKVINTGICAIPSHCFPFLDFINNENEKGEFYLTDICGIARKRGRKVRAFFYRNSEEVLGINTKRELFLANRIMRERILQKHLEGGVIISGFDVTIGVDVEIGPDTKIGNNVTIIGKTIIGEGVEVGSNVVIKDCIIGEGAKIGSFVYMENHKVEKGEKIPNFFMPSKGGKFCVE